MRINLVLGLRGPDNRPGLDNRHLIIEGHRGHRRSLKVIKDPFLWTLNFGFWTWIWDLDLGPGFGT